MVTLLKQGPVPLTLFICRTGGQTPCVTKWQQKSLNFFIFRFVLVNIFELPRVSECKSTNK